ncbi:MAG: hypothetical protein KAI80_05165 [Hyphomicrobiaceae bacterium]|nr:hypothetical protein [Hyphomicrobiaceae bacterium]
MQHTLCWLEDHLDDVAHASTSDERRRLFETLSDLAGSIAAFYVKPK